MEDDFTEIAIQNRWGSKETLSGPGSTIRACLRIIDRIPAWISLHGIRSIVDLGCGDFHWMSRVDLTHVDYDGYDIVEFLVRENQEKHGRQNVRFHHRNIFEMAIPKADLILLKDVLIHFPTVLGVSLLESVKASGSTWLAATTSPGWPVAEREGLFVGGFSPADLSAAPYSLGSFNEKVAVPHREDHPPKYLALWKLKAESSTPG
jgi:hypothetical protein